LGENSVFEVCFWGVRGGIARPGADTVRYGGNTACVEVRAGGHTLILDAGTGIRALGFALDERAPVTADILFSRTTLERIAGIPFFTAAYNPINSFRVWAGHLESDQGVHDILSGLMTDPVFPVPIGILGARIEFNDFKAGETLEPAHGVRVRSALLNPSMPLAGYRIECDGKSLGYVSDLIVGPDGDEAGVLELLADVDVAILNTAETSPGAADWRDGARLCDAAGAKTYVVFHHHPDNDDEAMDQIAAEAEALRPRTVVAREGMTLPL
jgi:phosphoribosyl 1,2-cyclic phosphodiesterase